MNDLSILRKYFYRLYVTLIKKYIKTANLVPSEDEQDCVKAFCVLTHAALEEYFEKLTKSTLNNAHKKYKSKKLITTIPTSQE